MATWANDAMDSELPKAKTKPASDYLNFDSDSGQESGEEPAGEEPEGELPLLGVHGPWPDGHKYDVLSTDLQRAPCVPLSGDLYLASQVLPTATRRMSSPLTCMSPPGRAGHLTQPVFTEHRQYARDSFGD